MREEQVAGAGGRVGGERLLGAQVAARLAVGASRLERRLADEQVGVARQSAIRSLGPVSPVYASVASPRTRKPYVSSR